VVDAMRYTTDNCDVDDHELVIFPGGNGDWYVGVARRDEWPAHFVRIVTSGVRVVGLAVAIADAYRAIEAAGDRAMIKSR
jgi:hypothetical protein